MLEEVLSLLNSFAIRTDMYIHPVEIATVKSYLAGLETGCHFSGLSVSSMVGSP